MTCATCPFYIFALSLFSCVHAFAPYLFCCWLSKANTMGAPVRPQGLVSGIVREGSLKGHGNTLSGLEIPVMPRGPCQATGSVTGHGGSSLAEKARPEGPL